MLVPTPDEDLGTIVLAAPVPRLTETPGRIAGAGRRVGQDTRRVLAEVAGFADDNINRLFAAKVVFEEGH
jgi:crotonobetainyl-CoA:carnitine CoA-transferase CaiB-like acyl-CoA transferase